MKKIFSLILLAIICTCLLSLPVFAITVESSGDDGPPYNDNEKYTYHVGATEAFKTHENGTKELVVNYNIQVRHKESFKFASIDKIKITLSNLPEVVEVYDKHIHDVVVAPQGSWEGLTLKNEIDYSYYAKIGSATGHKASWEGYIDEVKSVDNRKVEVGNFMGYPAIFVETEKYESGEKYQSSLHMWESGSVILNITDIIVPDGVFAVAISWYARADGEMALFSDLPDYQQRVDTVKEKTREIFEQSKENALSILDSYGSMTVKAEKTVDIRNYNNESKQADIVIDTDASRSVGETDVSVPTIIVVGIAGLAAASAGIGGSGGDPEGEGKKRSKYKMYVYKEFGDSIRYDKPAVIVYARMAEITPEGVEVERLDLTAQIEIFSQDSHMKVGSPTMAGNYIGATVEAESIGTGENPSQGIVSFKFSGEGGTFQNNVSFKLVGEPYIKFDEQGDYLFMEVNMILGDNGNYVVPFTLHDFVEVPEVTLKPQDNSPFEVELEKISDFKYKAIVKNISTKPEKLKAKRAMYNVEVTAETQEERQSNTLRAVLYPEGLSVSIVKFDKDGYAQIGAYADNESVEGQEEVLATRFKVELAVKSVDEKGRTKAKIVDLSDVQLEIGKLKGTDERTENFSKAFKYEIEETSTAGIYKFQPKMQIPEGKNKLYLTLPLSCDYQNESYSLGLPVRLLGEPFNEMKAKKEELDLLLKRIKRYMPPEDWSRVINGIKENYDQMSPREIRLLNKSLYEITARRLLDEAQSEMNFADTLDWVIWGLEWVKWVGDQAFSYVALVYTGPLGEALLTPAKEIMVGLISEDIWYREGISSPADKLRNVNSNLMAMLENSLMTQINSKTSLKKAGFILASFFVIKTINHYYNDVGPDGKPIGFYDAILAGFGDLTANACKAIVATKLEEFMNSPKAKAYFEKYVGDWVISFLDANAAGWQKTGDKLVDKYLQEICGAGAAKAYKKASQIDIDTKGGLVVTFNLWDDPKDKNNSVFVSIDILKVKDKLFDYIFNDMFGSFPFASKIIEPPKDPNFIINK